MQRRLAEREKNFLRLAERGIFGHRRSPYRPLLQQAGCEMGDLRQMVRTRGLENTLRALREAGVYLSFEEFKGRQPVVRNGHVIAMQPQDFDNPYVAACYQSESGGTTGAGTRVSHDLDHLAAQAPHHMLGYAAHDVLGVPMALWRGILPNGSGLNNLLRAAHCGHLAQKWFSPVVAQASRPSLKYRLTTYGAVFMGRRFGVPLPWPEQVTMDQALVVAQWAVKTLETQDACVILAPVSGALRACIAARETGLDLTGVTFVVGGEPPTDAKTQQITLTGARYFPTYNLSEAGRVGTGCGRPADGNDLHFLKDAFALIQYPRKVPGSELTVPAFTLTSLLPTAPKLLLNVETDDYGSIQSRSCGCRLEAYGFTEHLRDVHSFGKLTGEGVTLVGSEMVRILEEVLPARFGGTPLDYQLLEEENAQGFTRLSLVVHPKIPIAEETVVIEAVMQALRQGSVGADAAQAIWSQAGTLQVKRQEPIWTARGKLMPLHLARRSHRPRS